MILCPEQRRRLWSKFKRRTLQYSWFFLINPQWFLMFCFARVSIFRSWGIYLSKKTPYKINKQNKSSLFDKVIPEVVIDRLRKDGLYLGINLPKQLLSEISDFAISTSYFGNVNTELKFLFKDKDKLESQYGKKLVNAHHFNPALSCSAIEKIEQDPLLWEIAAQYLETQPLLVQTRLWWTFATEEAIDESLSLPFNYHYDVEDYRFIKFMFYINEVDIRGGPHVCIKGSYKKRLRHQFSLTRETTEQDILKYYGEEKKVTICGKAGTGFVEDFYCFHKGTVPIAQDRLILEVKFAMNEYKGIGKF